MLTMTRHDAKVMSDEQQRGVITNVLEQIENLRLDGYIECRRRLIRDKQFGFGDQRGCNHDALAHAAGQLVRISPKLAFRIRQTYPGQHLDHPHFGSGFVRHAMSQENLP